MKYRYKTFTECGKRPDNLDYIQVVHIPDSDRDAFILCDGMGRHAIGDEINFMCERNLDGYSKNAVKYLLVHSPSGKTIMMLGHGSDKGLFSRKDESSDFELFIGHAYNYYLRKHRLIGIWCHADRFAETKHLHILFSRIFISEMKEAVEYGITTTQQEIDVEINKFVERLRGLLDKDIPLHMIPAFTRSMDDAHSPLTGFNYGSIYYL